MNDGDSTGPLTGNETLWSIGEALVGATIAIVVFNLVSSSYDGTVFVPFALAILIGLGLANLVKRARLRAFG